MKGEATVSERIVFGLRQASKGEAKKRGRERSPPGEGKGPKIEKLKGKGRILEGKEGKGNNLGEGILNQG